MTEPTKPILDEILAEVAPAARMDSPLFALRQARECAREAQKCAAFLASQGNYKDAAEAYAIATAAWNTAAQGLIAASKMLGEADE